MADTSLTSNRKTAKQATMKLNYCFKPRIVRQSPLNKYDLSVLHSSDANSAEITDHFNYGFNSETFAVYAKLCKRFAEAEDIEHPNAIYDPNANKQFRFNDDAPIDLGGFGPFLDKELAEMWENDSFTGNESLMSFFVHFIFNNRCMKKSQFSYTLVQFIKLLSESQENLSIITFMDMLGQKISEKYERTMKILKKQEENTAAALKLKLDAEQLSTLGQQGKDMSFYDDIAAYSINSTHKSPQKGIVNIKQEVKDQEPDKHDEKEESIDSISYSSMVRSESQVRSVSDAQSSDHDNRYYKEKRNIKGLSPKQQAISKDQSLDEQEAPRNYLKDHLKTDNSYHKERPSRHKKHKKHKKKKSKKINKNKPHKKHKKHGKDSKKHKK